MICDCFKFREDLVNLSKDIFVREDEKPQWEVFEQFCNRYKRRRSQRPRNRFCSQHICWFLSRTLRELPRGDMALSTFLVDLLTVLYVKPPCVRRQVRFLRDTSFIRDREALKLIGALRNLWCSSDFMKLLLNFGFLSRLPLDSSHLMEALKHEFATFISDVAGCIHNVDLYSVKENAMQLLIKGNFYHVNGRENYKRIFLVIIALRGVSVSLMMKNSPLKEEFIGCLRMYFSATQDALISVFEVRSILYASFLVINRLDLFDICCQEFSKLMPECPAVMEPRRLTDITRCHIRKILSKSHLPLPSAIDKLLLPKILKSFLLGDVFDISRNSRNVSSQKCVTLSQLQIMMSGQ